MAKILFKINDIVWSTPLVLLILLVSFYYTIKLGFPQLTRIKDMVKGASKSAHSEKGLNQLQSFIFTAARTVGVGNIAGMATGIYFGGPGTIFWLWVLAFFGASIAMLEGILAQAFKVEVNGEFKGGPAYYMEKGFKNKKVGRIFAVVYAAITVISVTFLMPGVQTFNIVDGLNNSFGINKLLAGVIFTLVMGLVIFGGLKRIGKVAQKLSPIMAILYFLMSLIIIILNIKKLPSTILLIVKSAFGKDAVFGAILGSSVTWGIKRGVFANEVGVGSSAITSASSEVKHPVTQGMIGSLSVFMGSFFVCTTSAIMMLITDSYNVVDASGRLIVENLPGVQYGNAFISNSIDSVLPGFGAGFVAIAILCFAFVALTAYYLYTESNFIYLFGGDKRKIFILRICFVISIFIGSLVSADTVWTMGDIAYGLMAWINTFSLIFIGNIGVKIYNDFEEQRKNGSLPVFTRERLDIDISDVWDEE